MATKKEMIEKLVSLGYEEETLKDKKSAELEDLLKQSNEVEVQETVKAEQPDEQFGDGEQKANDDDETGTQDKASEQGSSGDVVADYDENGGSGETDEQGEKVVRETVHQLGIFTDYIYNLKNKGAAIVVENLGYGDVYLDTDGLAKVGNSRRLMFKETVRLEGISQVYFVSASQPVIQILEIK